MASYMLMALLTLICLTLPLTTKGLLRKSSECNASLGCISNPESTMMLTWQPASTHVLFTLRGYIGPGDLYVAVGLSHDDRMGEDDVTECVHTAGTVRVFNSYNMGRSNVRYSDGGLLNQSGIFENGTMQCSFARPVRGSVVSGGLRHDLNSPWHVLFVWGQVVPGTNMKQQHGYVSVSGSKVSLLAVGSFETQARSVALVNLHGCLMMVAWVTLTSIGIIMARHYKGLISGTEVCGKQVWFQVHRAMMVSVLLLTACGVIVIFLEVGGYSEAGHDHTDIWLFLHPILGLVVTSLAVLNPIIALFRPAPESPRRPIFNWVHRCVGTGSHVTAVVTLIFGLKLKKVAAPSSMLFVLGGFVAWHVTMEIILFCLVYVRKYRSPEDKRRESARPVTGQEDNQEADRGTQHVKVTVFQEILLMMHSTIAIATTIFLFALFLSKHDH